MNSVKFKCMAKTSTGKPCRFYAKEGESFCGRSNHNARTLKVGFNNHNAGFGKRGWSKYLPTEMLGRAETVLNHPDWKNLNQEIEYVNVDLAKLAESFSEIQHKLNGKSQQAWINLKILHSEIKQLDFDRDYELIGKKIAEVDELISLCVEEQAIQKEISKLMKLKGRLILQHQEFLVQQKAYLPLDQMMLFFVNLYQAIETVLPLENTRLDSHDAHVALKRILKRKFNMKAVK